MSWLYKSVVKPLGSIFNTKNFKSLGNIFMPTLRNIAEQVVEEGAKLALNNLNQGKNIYGGEMDYSKKGLLGLGSTRQMLQNIEGASGLVRKATQNVLNNNIGMISENLKRRGESLLEQAAQGQFKIQKR